MKKNILLLSLALLLVLVGCSNDNTTTSEEVETTTETQVEDTTEEVTEETEETNEELTKVVIGTSPTPHGEIVEGLSEEFKNAGIEIEVVNFDDYIQPNLALADGDLDLNFFQHVPYLETFSEEHNLELEVLGQVHVEPLALYSDKYDSVEDIPEGSEILIPNDPTNGARALLLLKQEGIIELSDPSDINATEEDITSNPKNLTFTALDAANIARTYTDVDGGIINANFAIDAGLNPTEDGLIVEGDQSPYANVVVSRSGEETNEIYLKVIEVLNSDAAREFIETEYEGNIKPVF